MVGYRVLITDAILEFSRIRKRDRDEIRMFLRSLRSNPYQEGDHVELDEVDRILHVNIVGKIALTYWADHAAKEVKVTNVRSADF